MTDVLAVDGLVTEIAADGGTVRAVDGVSLRIGAGEAVALVGESGCGKSMTALSVMRLLPRSARVAAGSVRFQGEDLLALSDRKMRQRCGGELAMVFQDPMTYLNPLIRIGDQVAEAVRLHRGLGGRAARAAALEALDRVRIPDAARILDSYPHQLSGGMRQRVLIAMAVVGRPTLLICDEPTTALDVTIQAQIMDLLRELRADLGTAMLLISHDIGLVAEYCDRVYVMYAAQVVEEADVFQLFAAPQHPYTRALIRSTLRADRRSERFVSIDGNPPSIARLPSGCRFHPRCPEAVAACPSQVPDFAARGDGRRARCLL